MDVQRLKDEVGSFLDSYNTAFASIDGARVAALYHSPCVTLRGDGSIHCLASHELERFFQGVADTYYREGYRNGRFKIVDVVPIGRRSALVTVDWELSSGRRERVTGVAAVVQPGASARRMADPCLDLSR